MIWRWLSERQLPCKATTSGADSQVECVRPPIGLRPDRSVGVQLARRQRRKMATAMLTARPKTQSAPIQQYSSSLDNSSSCRGPQKSLPSTAAAEWHCTETGSRHRVVPDQRRSSQKAIEARISKVWSGMTLTVNVPARPQQSDCPNTVLQ